MLNGNGSACIRRVSMRLLVLKWQFGFRMWSTLIIGGLLLLWVLRIHCSESLLLSTVLHILLPIVMEILVARFIYCGYRHSPRSKLHHTIRLSHFNQKIQNELVSRVGLVHFVFSDCSAYSMPEYAALFIVSCFNFWKCNQFFTSTWCWMISYENTNIRGVSN